MGNESKTRLIEIWRDWGMDHDQGLKKSQHTALEQLEQLDWRDFTTVLRAQQVLLADPETPGVGKRAAFEMFWNAVAEHWVGPAGKRDDVVQLQAMVLAVWPRDDDGEMVLLSLLTSPWEAVEGRAMQRSRLQRWIEESAWSLRPSMGATLRVLRRSQSLVEDESWLAARKQLKDAEIAISAEVEELEGYLGVNHGFSIFGPHITVLGEQTRLIVNEALPKLCDALARAMTVDDSPSDRQAELMWWGQARYCHALRTPYRRMWQQPEQVTWWAAWEAAARAQHLPVEPSAAYLQEVLHALGQDLDESRSLGEWMRGLHAVLAEPGAPVTPPALTLAELVGQDALGLPVTWVRLHAGAAIDDQRMGDDIGLPMDVSLDRGQWAAWLFRELSLDRALASNPDSEGEHA